VVTDGRKRRAGFIALNCHLADMLVKFTHFSIRSATRLEFDGLLATDCWFSVRYQVLNHFAFHVCAFRSSGSSKFCLFVQSLSIFNFIAQIN